jgi:hypothetical protein
MGREWRGEVTIVLSVVNFELRTQGAVVTEARALMRLH